MAPEAMALCLDAERERARAMAEALRVALNDCRTYADNLTSVQARCTELLEENRRLKAAAATGLMFGGGTMVAP